MIEARSRNELFEKDNTGSLRILLLGDASNFHSALATGLRRLGHDVVLASDGSLWMDTDRDIDLSRPLAGKLGGLALWLTMRGHFKQLFAGFDVVSLCSLSFVQLRPGLQRKIFDLLKKHNRGIFYTALGTDPGFVRECLDSSTPLQYNDFRIYGEPSPLAAADPRLERSWLSPQLVDLYDHVVYSVDGAMSCLWEYDVAMLRSLPREKVLSGAIPIDTRSIKMVELPDRLEKVRLFLGRHRDRVLEKGTDILEAAAKAVVERYPDKAELVIVENRPYNEYLELLSSAHVVLDQIYSYTPATNALLAMAMGLNAVSGGSPEYYRHIGERDLRPVIHVEPNYSSVYTALENTVLHPGKIRERGLRGRELVEKYNDCEKVASQNVDFWRQQLFCRRSLFH